MDTIIPAGLLPTDGEVYDSYMKGVNITKKGSGVPFDQALEQHYNRPAKVSGGIIGVTRKIALWGIIKHKKDQYVDLMKTKADVHGELSLHHNFNPTTAATIVKMVQDIKKYLLKVCSPLQDQVALKHILTGEIVTNVRVDKLLCCLQEGSATYAKYINDRLRKTSTQPSAKSSLRHPPKPVQIWISKQTSKVRQSKQSRLLSMGVTGGSLLRNYSSMRSPTLLSS